jgi:hypothetical protein
VQNLAVTSIAQLQEQDASLLGMEAVLHAFILAAGAPPRTVTACYCFTASYSRGCRTFVATSFSRPASASQALTSKKEAVVMWGCGAVLVLSCATLGSVAWWYQPRL